MKALLMASVIALASTNAIAQWRDPNHVYKPIPEEKNYTVSPLNPPAPIKKEKGMVLNDHTLVCDQPEAIAILAQGRKALGDINFAHYVAAGNCMEFQKGAKLNLGLQSRWRISPPRIIEIDGVKMISVYGLKTLIINESIHDQLMNNGRIRDAVQMDNQRIDEEEALASYVRLSDIVYP